MSYAALAAVNQDIAKLKQTESDYELIQNPVPGSNAQQQNVLEQAQGHKDEVYH